MTKIVILGGGFAGVAAALGLEKRFRASNHVSITIVDRAAYNQFNSNLYEVATAAEELENIGDLKKSICVPFEQMFKGKRLNFIQGEIRSIDPLRKIAVLPGKKIEYDYLILALGSQEEYFNIPGAKEYGIPLKSLPHALKIKNAIEFSVEAHKFDTQKKYVRIVIAGGGYTGVELAGELKTLLDFLSWKYNYPREKIEIQILEASNTLMPGMGNRATKDATSRLNFLGTRVKLLSPIIKVEQNTVEISTGEKLIYDVLIWTAGVRAKPLPLGLDIQTDVKGKVVVDQFLRAKGLENIFVLGDQAAVLKPNGQSVPASAQDAVHEAEYLTYALPCFLKNHHPLAYRPKDHGFIVSVGGKWAILNYPPFYFTGRLAYFIHELAHVRYFASILGWRQAVKLVWFQDRLYSRND